MSEERRVQKILDERQWEPVAIEHRGPDGSTVLSMLLFYCCPVCSAVVPPPPRQEQAALYTRNYQAEHVEEHLRTARAIDDQGRPQVYG